MADVEMKEATTEPAAKGKGTFKSEGANDGKKRFEVKKVQSQGPSVTTFCHLFWTLTWLASGTRLLCGHGILSLTTALFAVTTSWIYVCVFRPLLVLSEL